MNNFFATPEGGWGDGSVHLTTVGIAIVIAVIALLLIVAVCKSDCRADVSVFKCIAGLDCADRHFHDNRPVYV